MESSVVHLTCHLFSYQFIVFLLNTLLLKCDFTASAVTNSVWHLERRQLLALRVARETNRGGECCSLIPPRNGPKIPVFPFPLLDHLLPLFQRSCCCSCGDDT